MRIRNFAMAAAVLTTAAAATPALASADAPQPPPQRGTNKLPLTATGGMPKRQPAPGTLLLAARLAKHPLRARGRTPGRSSTWTERVSRPTMLK